MSDDPNTFSIGINKTDIADPLLDPNPIAPLLNCLVKSFDEVKLINSGKIEELEKIRQSYNRGDIYLVEIIDEILSKVKCNICQNPFKGKHVCGQLICGICIESENYVCTHCKMQFTHEMIRKYCGISLSCIDCRGKVSSSCGHYCESCILLNPIEFYNNCEGCTKYFNKETAKPVNCFKCKQRFTVLDMFEFCKTHFLCNECSMEQIETGECCCRTTLSIDKVEYIYEKTHFMCENCKYYYPKKQLNQSRCCSSNFCQICMELVCSYCNSQSFPANFR